MKSRLLRLLSMFALLPALTACVMGITPFQAAQMMMEHGPPTKLGPNGRGIEVMELRAQIPPDGHVHSYCRGRKRPHICGPRLSIGIERQPTQLPDMEMAASGIKGFRDSWKKGSWLTPPQPNRLLGHSAERPLDRQTEWQVMGLFQLTSVESGQTSWHLAHTVFSYDEFMKHISAKYIDAVNVAAVDDVPTAGVWRSQADVLVDGRARHGTASDDDNRITVMLLNGVFQSTTRCGTVTGLAVPYRSTTQFVPFHHQAAYPRPADCKRQQRKHRAADPATHSALLRSTRLELVDGTLVTRGRDGTELMKFDRIGEVTGSEVEPVLSALPWNWPD